MSIEAVVDAFRLPAAALVGQRIPKKLLVEQVSPTAAGKRLINDAVDQLQWQAALKPSTVGVQASQGAGAVIELAVLSVALRPDVSTAQTQRLSQLIHRATRMRFRTAELAISRGGVDTTETDQGNFVSLDERDIVPPDLIIELQDRTQLTRKSIVRILTESGCLPDFKRNAQQFIELAGDRINRTKRTALVEGIKYQRVGDADYFAQECFEEQELRGTAQCRAIAAHARRATVLVRPQFRKLHGLAVAQVETMLTDLAQHAIVLKPVAAPPAPDPGGQLLWELLAARADLLLVTGDKLLLRDAGMQGRVISPQAFVAGV